MDSERILVIDDDLQVLALISRVLRRSGYQVETVSNGKEALERLRHEAMPGNGGVSLVLSDLKMPGADGIEVLTRTRLIEHVWDFAYEGDSNVVDVYVRYLRNKVDRPFGRDSIETVRGSGYRLRSGPAA